ncbi:replication stress response regulator SDE2-like [Lolium rigidum]|uniref:replication stress response regulator SDE2-like n=1 Tax=Lolium rigidum TaxID=89674 RepID=UPI001F5C9CF5|nr:replication stress response regulator SDE2-like [Lolium rigidum]
MAEAPQYQIQVRLLDGRTRCLQFPSPTLTGSTLLHTISALTHIPPTSLRLVTGRRTISPTTTLLAPFPSASTLLRLRGGKGGFGSLLRGAASKAGQKKTSNFDACRDINGRRLRHVNAERRLEEWRAEAGDRRLERLAEDFLKKKAKEAGRGGRGVSAAEVDKYLDKYRRDAESCVNAVEESVRASLGKRKAVNKPRDAKKLKIWMGKKKVADDESDSESDSDSDVDDDEDADAKPAALDDGNCSNGSNKSEDDKVDLASVSGSHSEGESSGEKSHSSDSEKNGNALQESIELTIRSGCESELPTLECEGGMTDQPAPENTSENGTSENGVSALSEEVLKTDDKADVENTGSATSLPNDPEVPPVEESADVNTKSPLPEEPVDLTAFSSAAELEVLGMEKLKLELQTRGLKCGGTLQERAARLFLLKTTPLDKLPKKLLAKPNSGGK